MEMIALTKRSMSLLSQKEAIRTDLQPFKQETEPLAKIWCVETKHEQSLEVKKTYLKARYMLRTD